MLLLMQYEIKIGEKMLFHWINKDGWIITDIQNKGANICLDDRIMNVRLTANAHDTGSSPDVNHTWTLEHN